MLRRSLLDDLGTSMLNLIAERELAVGDQFESVRTLAERYAVAVPTVREALRRLEALGALELRHGSGVYVGPNVGRLVLANPLAPTGGRLVELLQARLLIEPPIAALAARAQSTDLTHLDAQLEQAAALIASNSSEQLAAVNMDFHRALAQASGNATLAEVVSSITVVNVREQLAIQYIHGDRSADLAEHRSILAAVRAGDAVLAEQLMRGHLDGVLAAVSNR